MATYRKGSFAEWLQELVINSSGETMDNIREIIKTHDNEDIGAAVRQVVRNEDI